MNIEAIKFLEPKNFRIKAKNIKFTSTKYMSDLDKKLVYVSFVKFVNSHFKFTMFRKRLYMHLIDHCGFIAHYNIQGFYGEYFETAAGYHSINGYKVTSEHISSFHVGTLKEQFFAIYDELLKGTGLSVFYQTLMYSHTHKDYQDINNALRDILNEYLDTWNEKLLHAQKRYNEQKTVAVVKSPKIKSLFDFAA